MFKNLKPKITTENSYFDNVNAVKEPVFVDETHISLLHSRDIIT